MLQKGTHIFVLCLSNNFITFIIWPSIRKCCSCKWCHVSYRRHSDPNCNSMFFFCCWAQLSGPRVLFHRYYDFFRLNFRILDGSCPFNYSFLWRSLRHISLGNLCLDRFIFLFLCETRSKTPGQPWGEKFRIHWGGCHQEVFIRLAIAAAERIQLYCQWKSSRRHFIWDRDTNDRWQLKP